LLVDIFKTSTPNNVSRTEYIFHWSQLNKAAIIKQKDSGDLIIRLQPEGVMRIFDSHEGFWGL